MLPRDVMSIVYRYVFDYYYCAVKREYNDVWLIKTPLYMCNVQYSFIMIHEYRRYYAANWRDMRIMDDAYQCYGIRSFKNIPLCGPRRVANLPRCYINSNGMPNRWNAK